jgi:5-formyltetrahydrofolate cyclo-ligase
MLKEELRRQMRLQKQQYSQQQLEDLSLPVISRLKPKLAEAQVVLAYYSLPDEVDTHQLVDDLIADGKTVLLPTVIGEGEMEWHVYTLESGMKKGPFGIGESEGEIYSEFNKETSSSHKRIIVLVPGVAFDAVGRRLGRGRGYYDRFLAAHPYIYKIGVCFDFQKVPEVPADEHDIPVDELI